MLAIASVGFGVIGCNKTNNQEEVTQSEVQENELEHNYIDDNYEMPEDIDLNEEFEDRVESNKNNATSSDNNKDTENNKDNNANTNNNSTDNNNNNNSSTNSSTTTKKASFEGFADDNFIEVKVGNDYATYRVSSEAKNVLSNKNIGDSITIELKEENGQLVINTVK